MAEKYYKSIDVSLADRTAEVRNIRANNNGSNMEIQYSLDAVNYKGSTDTDIKDCCNYKFLVLNKKCKDEVSTVPIQFHSSE